MPEAEVVQNRQFISTVLVASSSDVESDDTFVSCDRTSTPKLPCRTSTVTSDSVASVTVSIAPPQGVETTSVPTILSTPNVLPTQVSQAVTTELIHEDTVACNTLLCEFFERPDELFGQSISPLSPGLATPATVDEDSHLSREVDVSFACETHTTSEEVPLSQRAGEAEVPLLRRSASVLLLFLMMS